MATWGRQVIFISLLGFAACSSSTGAPKAAPPHSAPPTTLAHPTTTTTAPLYSFDNSVPPPTLVNTGTDYKRILQSLLDYWNWTAAHRVEPALAANFTAPSSQSDAVVRKNLSLLRDNKKRGYEIRDGGDEIRIVSQTPTVFTARVNEHIVTQLIVDSSGKVTSHRHMLEPITTYQYVVVRIGDRWYLASVSEVDTDVHL